MEDTTTTSSANDDVELRPHDFNESSSTSSPLQPPLQHSFLPGDHVIRWEMLPIVYPIQIHGIVLECTDRYVTIADFGLTTYQGQDQDGGGGSGSRSNEVDGNGGGNGENDFGNDGGEDNDKNDDVAVAVSSSEKPSTRSAEPTNENIEQHKHKNDSSSSSIQSSSDLSKNKTLPSSSSSSSKRHLQQQRLRHESSSSFHHHAIGKHYDNKSRLNIVTIDTQRQVNGWKKVYYGENLFSSSLQKSKSWWKLGTASSTSIREEQVNDKEETTTTNTMTTQEKNVPTGRNDDDGTESGVIADDDINRCDENEVVVHDSPPPSLSTATTAEVQTTFEGPKKNKQMVDDVTLQSNATSTNTATTTLLSSSTTAASASPSSSSQQTPSRSPWWSRRRKSSIDTTMAAERDSTWTTTTTTTPPEEETKPESMRNNDDLREAANQQEYGDSSPKMDAAMIASNQNDKTNNDQAQGQVETVSSTPSSTMMVESPLSPPSTALPLTESSATSSQPELSSRSWWRQSPRTNEASFTSGSTSSTLTPKNDEHIVNEDEQEGGFSTRTKPNWWKSWTAPRNNQDYEQVPNQEQVEKGESAWTDAGRPQLNQRYMNPAMSSLMISKSNTSSSSNKSEQQQASSCAPKSPQKLPKADPPRVVLARTRFLLEHGESILPPYHVFASNSECIAVWCMTGRWSTLQASVFLHSTAIGHAKTATAITLGVAATQPWLVPALAVVGGAAVGMPWIMLKRSKDRWEEATMKLNDLFWAQAEPEVFVECIEKWSGIGKDDVAAAAASVELV